MMNGVKNGTRGYTRIMTNTSKIIVALDYTNPLDALEMAAKLRDVVDGFKINHALWSQSVYIKDYTKDNLSLIHI